MLDFLNFVALTGAVQGIFFGLILLNLSRGNRIANRMLALFLVIYSLSMIGAVAYVSRWILKFPQLGLIHAPFSAVIFAPFLLYILALTQKDFRLKTWHFALFLPFFGQILWETPFYRLSSAEKYEYLLASYSGFPASWKIGFAASAIFNFLGLAASYLVILRHERVIREVYSNTEHKTLLWTRNFLYAGIATFLLCILVSFFDVSLADPVSNLLFSVVIYVFGYRAMRQPEIFGDVSADALPETETLPLVHRSVKYEKSGLSAAQAREWLDQLDRLMTGKKPFLDPMLNLPQLAAQLDLTPHQLSQLLNQFKGESFSDFVNRFRVEHFKQAVNDPDNAHLSLLSIAFDSGFNSKAAFNAVFKKMTGLTPSEFKDSIG